MLYELTMFGSYFGQQIVNRWNYISSGTEASVLKSFALVSAFGAIDTAGVYPAGSPFITILNALSNAFTVNSVVARAASLYDPTDFYERPFVTPKAGANTGQGMSPTIAYGFRTNRVRLDIGRGTKRLVGVCEGEVDAGGVINAGGIAAVNAIATKMTDVLSYTDEGATLTFTPCVVQKEEYTTESGKKAYRYYPTLAAQLAHTATSVIWQAYPTVRTQNSRQYGRGS